MATAYLFFGFECIVVNSLYQVRVKSFPPACLILRPIALALAFLPLRMIPPSFTIPMEVLLFDSSSFFAEAFHFFPSPFVHPTPPFAPPSNEGPSLPNPCSLFLFGSLFTARKPRARHSSFNTPMYSPLPRFFPFKVSLAVRKLRLLCLSFGITICFLFSPFHNPMSTPAFFVGPSP